MLALLMLMKVPVIVAMASALAGPASAQRPGIRDADFRAAMTEKFLAESPDPCESEVKVSIEKVEFANLDGTPGDEALVGAYSCLAGNSGVDLWAVFTIGPDGGLRELPVERPEQGGLEAQLRAGFRGYQRLTIEAGRLVDTYPVYAPGDPNASPSLGRRRLVYEWNGSRFVVR